MSDLDVTEALGGIDFLNFDPPEVDYWDWVAENEPPPVPLHIAINRIRRDVGRIAKLGVNSSGQRAYTFKRVEDVYAAVQDSATRHGVLIFPVGLKVLEQLQIPITYADSGRTITGSSVRVEVRYEWTGPTGDKMHSVGLGEGFDTSDKASTKATQAAMKFALIQALQIADDSVDADQTTIEKSFVQPKASPGAAFDQALSPTQAAYAKKGWPAEGLHASQMIVETQRDLIKKVLHKDSGASDEERSSLRVVTMGGYPPDPAKYEAMQAVLDPIVKRLGEDQPSPEPTPAPQAAPNVEPPATDVSHVIGVDPASIAPLTGEDGHQAPTFAVLQALAELLPPKAHVMFERWCTKYGVELGPRISPVNAEAAAQTIQMLRSE
jgi:hypothetical protein